MENDIVHGVCIQGQKMVENGRKWQKNGRKNGGVRQNKGIKTAAKGHKSVNEKHDYGHNQRLKRKSKNKQENQR